MSGTSMDGLDLAFCHLWEKENGGWDYQIVEAETIPYEEKWRLRLSKLRTQSSLIFHKTDRYYGEYIGQQINAFIQRNNIQDAELISSHGHTIFHQPEENITVQIGNGNAISAITGLPVVCDFRAMDVVLGGEGAPLAGLGDAMLFAEYDLCLNIGGFANISGELKGKRIAYDVCPANIVLNRIAREFGQDYDRDGEIASRGKIDYELLETLNNIPYYSWQYPKSLGREWINDSFWFYVKENPSGREDKMKTLVDHIACQISASIEELSEGKDPALVRVLATGGGALNKVLVDHLQSHSEATIVVPEEKLVAYKEALIFALFGVLRIQNKVNVWASATGADRDSVSGSLHGNFEHLLK